MPNTRFRITAMRAVIFIFLVDVAISFSELEQLPEILRQAVLCSKYIVTHYFDEDHPIAISDPRNTYTKTLPRLLSNISYYNDVSISDVIVNELTNGISRTGVVWYPTKGNYTDVMRRIPRDKPLQFIIILSDYNGDKKKIFFELTDVMDLYIFHRNNCLKSKIVIAFPVSYRSIKNMLLPIIMDLLQGRRIYDVVLIFPRIKRVSDDVTSKSKPQLISELYNWFPFSKPQQCGKPQGLTLLDNWIQDGKGKPQYETELFPNKLPKVFDGCEFLCANMTIGSISEEMEWSIIKKVFTSINVTLVFKDLKNYDGIFFRAANNRISSTFLLLYNFDVYTSISFPHLFSHLHCYVPCPKENHRQGNFYKVFTPSVWLLLFLTCILSAVILMLIHKFKFESSRFKSISYNFYYIWAIVTSVSVPQIPTTTRLRIVFIVWVCYSMIISTVFQSFFTSFLIEPGSQKQISNMEELLSEGFNLFAEEETIFAWFMDNYNDSTTISDNARKKYNISISTVEEFFRTEDSAFFATDLDMKIILPAHLSGVKLCSFPYSEHSMYNVRFNPLSAYYEAFNHKVLLFFEAGLFIKLINDYTSLNSQSITNVTTFESKLRAVESEEFFVLNIQHLSVVFLIYLYCNGICCIVFLGEVVSFKIKSWYSKQ